MLPGIVMGVGNGDWRGEASGSDAMATIVAMAGSVTLAANTLRGNARRAQKITMKRNNVDDVDDIVVGV